MTTLAAHNSVILTVRKLIFAPHCSRGFVQVLVQTKHARTGTKERVPGHFVPRQVKGQGTD